MLKGERTKSNGTVGERRIGAARPLLLLTCIGLLVLLIAAPAASAEEETHLFNATLSLTGDCTTATIDPVPDPGCPEGDHPPKPFTKHGAVAVDLHGNRYVVSVGGKADGSEGRIDVFDSSGQFVTEVAAVLPETRVSVAVDAQGYLYLSRDLPSGYPRNQKLLRFTPTEYNPAAGEIEYGAPPVAIPDPEQAEGNWRSSYLPLAVDPENDHLFVAGGSVLEFSSAAEGNGHIETFGQDVLVGGGWSNAFALDSVRKRVYVSDVKELGVGGAGSVVKVIDLEAPHELLFTLDGSTTPTKKFVSESRVLPLAVDEASGHLFVGDLEAPTRRIYEFDEDGNPVSTIVPEGGFKATSVALLELAYDDSPASPTEGYLFVPSHTNPGRSLAFGPKPPTAAPEVEALSVSGITDREAILQGKVNPKSLQTSYRIEYTTEAQFEAQGFEGATLAGEGTLSPAAEGLAVSAPVSGLAPGTAYRFRVVAGNELGAGEADAPFTTYTTPEISTACPNQALRSGPSATLPDCRAYELVTPADTNAHPPFAAEGFGPVFPSTLASPAGDALSFTVNGGVIPDTAGTGGIKGDPYLSSRGGDGWHTVGTGPSGDLTQAVSLGSAAPDQLHSTWRSKGPGPAQLEGEDTTYLRFPDGHFEPLGEGSLATEPGVTVRLIAAGASHAIFNNDGNNNAARQLEPDAPPEGTRAIYDRTADGTVHVVSLLPGDLTPAADQDASFKGASLDGEGVAFEIEGTLYLRHRNEATHAIGTGLQLAGLAAQDGARLFYLQGGDLYRFDAQEEATTQFSEAGDVTVVNLSADGSAAYFVSPSVLTGEPNPAGDTAQPGERNLYLSREGQISFLATVSDRDVDGEFVPGVGSFDGLGLWIETVGPGQWGDFAVIPARTTPDGGVLLFESNAPLTDYDPEGHTQVYRYDSAAGTLRCLSCNPTGAAATGEAALQTLAEPGLEEGPYSYLHPWNLIANLSPDGKRAFFESTEALVLTDTDGLRDVYEWEEEGVGGCETAGGCLHLISSGRSGREELLYAVSESGDDVFFRSADLLVSADPDETPSIYDARVNGGFAPPQGPPGECLGEACQPAAVAPEDPTPASNAFQGAGNVPAAKPRCRNGKRAVRRRGKVRCVSKKKAKQSAKRAQRRGAGANRRAHR